MQPIWKAVRTNRRRVLVVAAVAVLCAAFALLWCLRPANEGYDFRTYTVMNAPKDYAYLQENWDVLLEQLGDPPEGGVQIVERKSDENAQKANWVLESGVKCYSMRVEHLLYWLHHGGLVEGVTQSRDFTWYFPVQNNAEGFNLVTLRHNAAIPQLDLQESYNISHQLTLENDDGTGGYAFHPERVQELLDEKGITGARILLPFDSAGISKDGETFGVQAIYIESDQGVYFIPYSGNWRNDGMYFKRLHLYTKEEFEEILAFHVSELDPAEPIPWESWPK